MSPYELRLFHEINSIARHRVYKVLVETSERTDGTLESHISVHPDTTWQPGADVTGKGKTLTLALENLALKLHIDLQGVRDAVR